MSDGDLKLRNSSQRGTPYPNCARNTTLNNTNNRPRVYVYYFFNQFVSAGIHSSLSEEQTPKWYHVLYTSTTAAHAISAM